MCFATRIGVVLDHGNVAVNGMWIGGTTSARPPPAIIAGGSGAKGSLNEVLVQLLLLFTLFTTGHTWREAAPKPCPAGCLDNGNCNHELGMCECNFGWAGPSCQDPILGACRSSDSRTALVMYGRKWPKSCQCWRQLFNHSTSSFPLKTPRERWWKFGTLMKEVLPGTTPDPFVSALDPTVKYCYERENVPPHLQFSDVPLVGELGLTFLHPMKDFIQVPAPSQILSFIEDQPLLPLRFCPRRCMDRGACLAPKPPPEAGAGAGAGVVGSCQCRKGFHGVSCEISHLQALPAIPGDGGERACLNQCSGMGECWSGFCKCPPGAWGMDCSRTKSYEPEPEEEAVQGNATAGGSRTSLRIYRYEVPWQVSFPLEQDDGRQAYDHMYAAFERFFEAFSGDWVVRTENPWEANLFYVPMLNMYRFGRGDTYPQLRHVLQYIREQYPSMWNRNQGRDHFVWLSGDMGACLLPDDPLVQAPIKIVHFGLQVSKEQYRDMPGWEYSHRKDMLVPERYNCFLAGRDVVAASNDVANNSFEYKDLDHWERALNASSPPRKHLLYFGGSIRENEVQYSGGARQAYHKWVNLRNHPRVKFGGGLPDYRDADFCFCPYGSGWGNRLSHIVLAGCVPVIVQEHVHQPYDDLLPYRDFSLTLRVQDMPQLLDILQAVQPQQLLQYRRNLYLHRRAFYYYGDGQAYNMTLAGLWRSATHMWSRHNSR